MVWEVPCTVDRVVDGDTVVVIADLGFNVKLKVNVRIYGINAPETNTAEGREAKGFALDWFNDRLGLPVAFESLGPDKYGGRWLGRLTINGEDFSTAMLEAGYAVKYMG